ncbi:protein GRINL1A isoform X2 [Bombina bombina]|uniref:protein GRINL1A isoform X2 n=1 Tax=Bombina bombina TaxID=8345 RepID=UPI00235AEB1B|nr:protein GRINL1A isoform X2 [Bombina bombina]
MRDTGTAGKFVAKLPDRGKRILEYTDKVRHAIAEQKESDRKSELLTEFKLEFQAKQTNGILSTQVEAKDNGTTQMEKVQTKSAAVNSHYDKQENQDVNSFTVSGLDDILVNDLKKFSLKDRNEEPNRTLGTSANPERNPFSLQTGKPNKSYFIEVIENRAMHPVQRKDKFRTNALPSSSASSSISLSPGGNSIKVIAEERKAHDRKYLDDITAAHPAPLHNSPIQLLPLEESLALQLAQKKSYEEKQAKVSAQKLVEKMNIKMVKFNPEGDSYMKYRDLRETEEED